MTEFDSTRYREPVADPENVVPWTCTTEAAVHRANASENEGLPVRVYVPPGTYTRETALQVMCRGVLPVIALFPVDCIQPPFAASTWYDEHEPKSMLA